MNALKIFLITGFILLFVAAGAVGYVWFKLQNALDAVSEESTQEQEEVIDFVQSAETPIANTVPDTGIQIDTSAISAEQKAAAQKVGIDLDTIVITPEMVSCAEQKLGSVRVQEIMDGESPSTLEGFTLLNCL